MPQHRSFELGLNALLTANQGVCLDNQGNYTIEAWRSYTDGATDDVWLCDPHAQKWVNTGPAATPTVAARTTATATPSVTPTTATPVGVGGAFTVTPSPSSVVATAHATVSGFATVVVSPGVERSLGLPVAIWEIAG